MGMCGGQGALVAAAVQGCAIVFSLLALAMAVDK